ncbi:hypothetical protein BDR05DRAFT_603407 [Suillus weaverae]|nr:hypothetical protein BDR05DRAFT_603407 [Suillus weaverae]
MTLVSNDPIWWPFIVSSHVYSYVVVASSAAVLYDWALTFGQEVELIWRKHWSLMTLLYFSVRYAAMPYTVFEMLFNLSTVSMTDAVSHNMYMATSWMFVVVNALAGGESLSWNTS